MSNSTVVGAGWSFTTLDQDCKAGEIFVLGDPDNHHACTREEADLMAAAQRAREVLVVLDEQEANFIMMQHIGEIAGEVPGAIPGYATHLDEVAKMARYLKYGGYVGVGFGASSSYLKVQEACKAGETDECKKIRFTEAGGFAGGLVGGVFGGAASGVAIKAVCNFGVWGKAICGIATVGVGSFAGSGGGVAGGEWLGEVLYEGIHD